MTWKYGCLILLLALCGCNAVNQIKDSVVTIKSCKFTLKKVRPEIKVVTRRISLRSLRNLGRDNIKLGFHLHIDIYNPTSRALSMNRMELTLYVDGERFASGDFSRVIDLPAKAHTPGHAYLDVNSRQLSSRLIKRIKSGRVSYRVDATFYSQILGTEIPVNVTLREGVISR